MTMLDVTGAGVQLALVIYMIMILAGATIGYSWRPSILTAILVGGIAGLVGLLLFPAIAIAFG